MFSVHYSIPRCGSENRWFWWPKAKVLKRGYWSEWPRARRFFIFWYPDSVYGILYTDIVYRNRLYIVYVPKLLIFGTPNIEILVFLSPPKCSESIVNSMFSIYYSISRCGSENLWFWCPKAKVLNPGYWSEWPRARRYFDILVPGARIQGTWYQATGCQVWWYCGDQYRKCWFLVPMCRYSGDQYRNCWFSVPQISRF